MQCEEADTRLIFNATTINEVVVIVAKDTSVFLFLIYALGQLGYICPPWNIKID